MTKGAIMRMGQSRRGQQECRDLPPFNAPKTGKHSKLPRRKGGKIGRGY
jgi:hypothetical protein